MLKRIQKISVAISITVVMLAFLVVGATIPLKAASNPATADVKVTIQWTQISSMSRPRHSGATVVVDGVIYTIGGIETGGKYKFKIDTGAPEPYRYQYIEVPVDTTGIMVEAYDPKSGQWTEKAGLPYPPDPNARKSEGRIYLAAAAHKGKIYTFGGADVNGVVKDTIDVYDIATDTWTAGIAKFPKPTTSMSAAAYGDKIYLFGGSASTDQFAPEYFYSDCYVFEPGTAKLSRISDLPNSRAKTFALVFKNRISVVGGYSGWGNRNHQIYDPATDSWSFAEPIIWERGSWFGTAANDMVLVVGGRDEMARTAATVDIYSDQWQNWVAATSLPSPREDGFAAAVDGKVYIIGGRDNKGNPTAQHNPVATAEVGVLPPAPPALNLTSPEPQPDVIVEWSEAAPVLTPRAYGATVAVDNIIYTIGGLEAKSPTGKVVEAYDPAADKWTARALMPEGRFSFSAAAYKGKIYTFGGVNTRLQVVNTVDVYDIATDTWKAKVATLPKPAAGVAAMTYGDKIYVFGGSRSPMLFTPYTNYYNDAYEFDPVTLAFTPKNPMPVARNMSFACILGNNIYVIGGVESPGATANQSFSPGTNSWQKAPEMPQMRGGHSGAAIGSKAYIIGGHGKSSVFQFNSGKVSNQWAAATSINTGRNVSFSIAVKIPSPKIPSPRRTEGSNIAFAAGEEADIESIFVIGGCDSKGNILSSVEKGIPGQEKATPESKVETKPTPEAKPETPSGPKPLGGMSCGGPATAQSTSQLDGNPLLLGALVACLAIVGFRRNK